MTALIITAGTAISAMGRGMEATRTCLLEQRQTLQPDTFQSPGHGYIGRVAGVEDHQLLGALHRFDCRNNRLADMALMTDDFMEAVADARAHYGRHRLAVVMGTSTSGILTTEKAYAARKDRDEALPPDFPYDGTQDLSSLPRYVAARLDVTGPMLTVSNACASSTRAFIDAAHLLATGLCDAAIVGGADSLCRMTLQGFASLGLVSAHPTRPCDAGRSGISIGEAAGFALLERADGRPRPARPAGYRLRLLGYGASSDGHHMSSPDPTGSGAALAIQKALARASLPPEAIGYINMHGTGTPANDQMEDRAMASIFGRAVPCSSTKGWSGHTLGASGILESMICAIAIQDQYLPHCMNSQTVDPLFQSDILLAPRHGKLNFVMNNSFGFGGTNSSLIFGPLT
ncbi:beta-ketoacyl-[acyl-carrier-protein] synthase family protein [Parasaccharibacter apium]|uniref:beta-ketoacyl-[acyl-carrier-protein] synthase family protein n=1 Tax=Parasaccharibacter apium TaxID=1510841 RepID=UPI0009D95A01|nr:beta-ketoacyl-[acyl-carrier-protein] synthase family protein [Parasaccharibacter apium]